MKLKKIFVALVVLAILAVSAGVMWVLIETKPESVKNPDRKTIIGVKTMPIVIDSYQVSMKYPGRVNAREIVTLTSEVSGKIMPSDVQLKEGGRFKKGDVIVNIFDEDVKASHSAQISNFLNTLSSSLPDIKIDFPEEYDKWANFFSKIEIDKKLPKLPNINSDKEKVYISTKNILSAYYSLIEREIVLSRYQIKAPFNGIYTSVSKEVGSIASTNGEIAKITSTDYLEFVVGVSLADAQKLSIGTSVEIISESGKAYNGRVERVSAFVNNATQRVNVYVTFYEPAMEIVEGQMLTLNLASTNINEVTETFREAIVGDSLVYVIKNNKLSSRIIKVMATSPTHSYIQGLTAGDTLVNESLVSPYDGMEVNKLDMNGAAL